MTRKRPKVQFKYNSLYGGRQPAETGAPTLCHGWWDIPGRNKVDKALTSQRSVSPSLAAECLFNSPSRVRCLPTRRKGHRLRDPGSEQVISLGTHCLAAQWDHEVSFVSSPTSPWRDAARTI